MKNKDNVIKFGVLILGIVMLIVGLIMFSKNDNNLLNKEPNEVEENKKENQKVYTCENEISDLNYTSYQIETIYVEGDTVIKTVPSMKVVCKDILIYNVFKNDKEYSEGKTFDDKTLTITFKNGEEVMLDKDVNGNKTKVTFISYQEELNKVGYTCQEK